MVDKFSEKKIYEFSIIFNLIFKRKVVTFCLVLHFIVFRIPFPIKVLKKAKRLIKEKVK